MSKAEKAVSGKRSSASPRRADPQKLFSSPLAAVAAATGAGLWEWDLKTGRVVYSSAWERLTGYEAGEVEPSLAAWKELILPEDRQRVEEESQRFLSQNEPDACCEMEYRVRRKDGSVVWMQDRGVVTRRDDAGVPLCMMGYLQDITRIHNTEQQLEDKSRQLDFVAQMAGLGCWEWNIPDGSMVFSDIYLKMMGQLPNDNKGSYSEWLSYVHPDERAEVAGALEDFAAGRADSYSREVRMRHRDGHYIWTQDTGMVMERDAQGAPVRIVGGHLNIDRLKQDEQRLQQEVARSGRELEASRQFSAAMFEANPYINVIFDDKLKPVDCNPAAVSFFGFSSKEELLQRLMVLMSRSIPEAQPDGRPSVPLGERFQYAVEFGFLDIETELILYGAKTPVRAVFKKLPFEDSFIVAVYVIDLRSLKETRNELLRQDKLLREVNAVAAYLMSSRPETFELSIWNSLKKLGQGVGSSSMSVWRNTQRDAAQLAQQIYEWSEAFEDTRNAPGEVVYAEIPAWGETLVKGKSINAYVKNLSMEEQRFLSERRALSVLCLPVFIRGVFWGFISIEDAKREKVFTATEEKALQSSGMLIVSAILRNEINHNLILAREEALASTRAKSDFLSRMSHEIRTPMNAIIGMCAIAEKTGDMNKIRHCLEKINVASGQMMEIINDILDMSKIESDRLEIVRAEFDFERMMQNILNVVGVKAAEKRQNFVVNFTSLFTRNVIGDELRLSQVITNLLNNAVKFTPEGGEISLRVRNTPRGENAALLRVEVQDNGIGIEPEKQEKLFDMFEQGDGTTTRKYGGSGLGLAISKRVVRMMGGDVWLQSEPGLGSTFSFEVPVEWGRERIDTAGEACPREGVRVLAADDNEDVRMFFQNMMGSFSVHCDVAADAAGAVEMVRAAQEQGTPYDIVFLDWKLHGASGVAAARKIREIPGSAAALVLISVADLSEIEEVEGAVAVVDKFLPKPILPSVLFNTVVELSGLSPVTAAPGAEARPMPDWSGSRILIAEDIDVNREIVLGILEETGLEVDCAATGAEAVALYSKNWDKYRMVLMDVQMPELDGLGATRQIRASGYKTATDIPIVAMTANAFKEDVENCLAAGMNDHISKPIDLDELLDKMSHYMSLPSMAL